MSSNNTLLGVGEAAPSDGSNDLLNAALDYAAQGWPVFPCQPRGKAPLTTHGFKDASTEPEGDSTRGGTRGRTPTVGIAVPAGYIVVDIDGPNGWTALGAEGYTLSASVRAQTGRGPGHEGPLVSAASRSATAQRADQAAERGDQDRGRLRFWRRQACTRRGRLTAGLTPLAEDDIADASEWMLALTQRADATEGRDPRASGPT